MDESRFADLEEEVNRLLDAGAALNFEDSEGTPDNEQFHTLILDKPDPGTTTSRRTGREIVPQDRVSFSNLLPCGEIITESQPAADLSCGEKVRQEEKLGGLPSYTVMFATTMKDNSRSHHPHSQCF